MILFCQLELAVHIKNYRDLLSISKSSQIVRLVYKKPKLTSLKFDIPHGSVLVFFSNLGKFGAKIYANDETISHSVKVFEIDV
ncbi:hypothetical protein BpHYR1_031413 [Brachionus plicatilis]|uniref:Uncharacterized protein n=1 Tax=Brachionus plicatilis TaxID=10195 RepID=A0A3M7PBZ6_BRAPC|nr:hypothetical protein BpHYR1_031413 [Brachionus plicatilis]